MSSPPPADQLPSENWSELGRIIKAFEDAWQRGERPSVDAFLPTGTADRRALLVELLHTDLECRLKAGEAIRVEVYLERYPELAGDSAAVLDLIVAEYRQRCRREVDLTPAEYCHRFPPFSAQFLELLQESPQADTLPPPPAGRTLFERLPDNAAGTDREPPGVTPRWAVLGAVVTGYELLEELGRGGMGVVYKARQIRLNRLVALKMILAGVYAGREERKRFRIEAEAAARLQHANIVQIYEVGEHEGRPFLSLELVEGGSLAQRLQSAPLPPRQAAELAETLAHTMHYAHQRGILHRDLKPANILLTPEGAPKVTDFGLAKQLYLEAGNTPTGDVLGTPSYMAPEQAEARGAAISPAVDVYALGAILYELLTGRPPFRAATALDTMKHVVAEDPVPPTRLQPKVPRDLETVCLKCLEKEPGKRYASALELAQDLRRFLDGEPIQARRAFLWERGVKWARRRPVVAGLTAALVLVLMAAFLGMGGLWLRAESQREQAERARGEADQQRAVAEAEGRLAEDRLIRMQVANGVRRMDDGDLFGALPWFARALEEDKDSPDRQQIHRMRLAAVLRQCPRLVQLWRHRGRVNSTVFSPDGQHVLLAGDDGTAQLYSTATGKEVTPPLKHSDAVVHAAFSPDGRYIATASWDQTARVWDAASGKELCRLEHTGAVVYAVFSRDGRSVATASHDHSARVWEAATGKPLSPPLEHDDHVSCVEFSPDGRHVATAGSDHKAQVWKIDSRKALLAAVLLHGDPVLHVAYSPDGRFLATASADKTARVWDPATGKELRRLEHNGAVEYAVFSPDSHLLVTAGADQTARVWEAATGRPVSTPLLHNGAVVHAAFSPNSLRLVTAADDGTARVWDAATGRPLSPPLKHNETVVYVAFHPDGGQVITASHDQTARVWDVAPARPATPPLMHAQEVWHATFSADGRRVATADNDRTARVWDVASGRRLLSLPHAEPVVCVAFSPDGRRIVTASHDDTACIWDGATGKAVTPPLEHTDAVVHAAFSPDGRRVVTASHDRTARVWDAATGKELCSLEHKGGLVAHAAFSPDGRRVVTASYDHTAQLWDATTGKPMLRSPLRHAGPVVYAAFSPDGRLVATASTDRKARVWDAATGQLLSEALEHRHEVRRVAFSSDSQRVVTASNDHTARVWNAATGEPLTPPLRHAKEVRHAAFSPDGRRVVTAGDDGVARVWDAATGLAVTPPLAHHGPIPHAAFSPDGFQAVTASADGTARLWDLSPDPRPLADLLLLAQLLSGRKLDKADGIVFLQAEQLERAWKTLRAKYPKDFSP